MEQFSSLRRHDDGDDDEEGEVEDYSRMEPFSSTHDQDDDDDDEENVENFSSTHDQDDEEDEDLPEYVVDGFSAVKHASIEDVPEEQVSRSYVIAERKGTLLNSVDQSSSSCGNSLESIVGFDNDGLAGL